MFSSKDVIDELIHLIASEGMLGVPSAQLAQDLAGGQNEIA